MDQDIYDAVFIEMLKTDESLLGAITGFGEELARPGKVINLLQKSLDEGSALWEWLSDMGFTEGEIRELIWSWSQDAYGSKSLNDWADYYEITKASHLLEMLGLIDDMAVSAEADAKSVLAMQEVFAESESDHIRYATQKAIGARTGSKVITAGIYTIEFLGELFIDNAISNFEDAYEKYAGITSLDKLRAEVLVWVYDKALSLTEKSNAIMYSEVYSLIQLELANYYYDNHYDHSPENNMMMHSVALLYLRSCLAAWKLYEFDKSLSQPITNAKASLESEISNLMTYTEEELLQNGTSDDCMQAIIDLVHALSKNSTNQAELFDETYWHMSFGQSLGFNYVAKFSMDGTFVALGMGSGEYIDGTYSYTSGELTIVFDIAGFGYPETVQFRGDASGFTSINKYAMQVGEEYYTISPVTDGSNYFDEPAESEPQAWEGDGTYAYSLVTPPYFEGNYISVYLRHPYRDIETAMNEMNNVGPRLAGICGEDNEYAGEIYSVEYVDSIVDAGDGCIYMYTRTVDGSALNMYTIESDGYYSVENGTDAWSGWGIKLCWFEPTYLELSSNCLFGDDRIDMTFEEMQHVFDQGYAQWGEFTEVNVTVRGGKITEFILPYAP